jgi:hypothetical protein
VVPTRLVVVMFRSVMRVAVMVPAGRLSACIARVSGNNVTTMGVGRCLGSILIDLALKNQRRDPNGLDYGENERSNEPCDDRRKYCLTDHKNSVAGESGAVPGIVRGVMHRRQRREAHEVHETETQKESQGSDDGPILRQGRGA